MSEQKTDILPGKEAKDITMHEATGLTKEEVDRVGNVITGVVQDAITEEVSEDGEKYAVIELKKAVQDLSDVIEHDEAVRRVVAVNTIQGLIYRAKMLSEIENKVKNANKGEA